MSEPRSVISDPIDIPVASRPQIRVENAVKSFAGRVVVDVEDLTLGAHAIEGLIGPNGAGKTTLLRMIMHSVRPDSGRISFIDPDDGPVEAVVLSDLPAHEIAKLGVVKTNQVIQDFANLTIWDSLLLSAADTSDEHLFQIYNEDDVFAKHEDEIRRYLDAFPFEDPMGFARSAGEKKLVDIIRCLLLKPKILLLDEPAAGLPEDIRDRIMDMIKDKTLTDNVSVVIVEHDLDVVWRLSAYVHFMAEGKVILDGEPDWIREHETVIDKYLGSEHV